MAFRQQTSSTLINPLTTPESFSHFYAERHLMVFRYLYGLNGGPREEVEDITAETFHRAWRNRSKFTGNEQAALGWVLRIGRNLIIDEARKRKRRGIPDSIEDVIVPDKHATPEEQAIVVEQVARLWRLLHTLDDRQREILVLRYLLSWRVKDIAVHVEMPENSVSVTIRRLLKRLRENWHED